MNYTLDQLQKEIKAIAGFVATDVQNLPLAKLNQHPASGGWSLLECLEHLNRYSRYYNSSLGKAISGNQKTEPEGAVTLTWLGRKSIEMISPENQKKQKTIRKMNPQGSALDASVITEFLAHQRQLLDLIKQAEKADLGKKAVPVEFFRLLKLNIGETLVFMTEHEKRHFGQLQRILEEVAGGKKAAA